MFPTDLLVNAGAAAMWEPLGLEHPWLKSFTSIQCGFWGYSTLQAQTNRFTITKSKSLFPPETTGCWWRRKHAKATEGRNLGVRLQWGGTITGHAGGEVQAGGLPGNGSIILLQRLDHPFQWNELQHSAHNSVQLSSTFPGRVWGSLPAGGGC